MATQRKRRNFGAVRRLPSGRWQASYLAPDGLRRNAPSTFTTKADAHAWLTVRQSELLRGDWIDPELGRLTLGAYAPRWIAEHRLGPRTRDLYESLYRLHIGPILGSTALAGVTTESVRLARRAASHRAFRGNRREGVPAAPGRAEHRGRRRPHQPKPVSY